MATTFEVLYLGTGPEIDTVEGDVDSENARVLVGTTFGSAADPLGFGAQKTFSPVDFSGGSSTMYDIDNNLSNDTFSIDGGPAQTFDGLAVYNATITYTDGTPPATITATVFQDTAGNIYLAPETSTNADYTAMIAAPIQSITLDSIFPTSTNRMLADRQSTDFVCYASGTNILTDLGEVPVEQIKSSDLVMTLDHGLQAVRWIRGGDHSLDDAEDDSKPIKIKAGTLGRNLPAHDLIVSPQHRIFVGGSGQLTDVFDSEALVPAKSLIGVPGIRRMKGRAKITWIHFACDRHEIVTANGCLSESLLLGPMVLKGLQAAERRALSQIFGTAPLGAAAALNGPPARECLTVEGVKCLLSKRLKEKVVARETQKWDRDLAMERYETDLLRVVKIVA